MTARPALTSAALSLVVVGLLAPTAHAASTPRLVEAGQAACRTAYSVTQVGDLGGTASWPTALANNGVVGGTARAGATPRPQLPYVQRGGEASALDVPSGSTFGRVLGVTERGTAAGEVFTTAPEKSRPAFWDAAGRLTLLAAAGVAEDLNNRGQVVGASPNADGVTTATVWFHGTTTYLPGLTDADHATDAHGHATALVSRAADIDESGTIVGSATAVDGEGDDAHGHTHATLWDRHGAAHDLGVLRDHGTSRALAVSGPYVVGEANRADGTWAGVTFTSAGPVELADTPWAHESAKDVNRRGEVVGEGARFAGNASFGGSAYVWCEGRAVDLATVTQLPDGWSLQSARAVNDRGQIAATARDAAGHTVSVLLTPTR